MNGRPTGQYGFFFHGAARVSLRLGVLLFVWALAWSAAPPAVSASETGTPHWATVAPPPGGAHKEEKTKGWGVLEIIGKVFNFLVLAGVLLYALKTPLRDLLSRRGQAIRRKLAEAEAARDVASAKLAEAQRTLARLHQDLSAIKAQAEKDAEMEHQRIQQAAGQEAAKILELSRREIESQVRAAQLELRRYVAELTVGLAENMIRRDLKTEDDHRVFERFLENLKSGSKSIH